MATLAAPLVAATLGVPGILFASQAVSTSVTSTQSSIQGGSAMPFTGVIYFPRGIMTFQGSAGNSSTGCSEVIAGDISVTGASALAANCSSYTNVSFGSLPTSVTLVE